MGQTGTTSGIIQVYIIVKQSLNFLIYSTIFEGAEMHVDWIKWYDYIGGDNPGNGGGNGGNDGCECKAKSTARFYLKIRFVYSPWPVLLTWLILTSRLILTLFCALYLIRFRAMYLILAHCIWLIFVPYIDALSASEFHDVRKSSCRMLHRKFC